MIYSLFSLEFSCDVYLLYVFWITQIIQLVKTPKLTPNTLEKDHRLGQIHWQLKQVVYTYDHVTSVKMIFIANKLFANSVTCSESAFKTFLPVLY